MTMRYPCRKTIARLAVVVTLLIAASTFAAVSASAQTAYGTILGAVLDTTGAVVPEATVTISNLGTGETRVIKSDAEGNFRFVNLLPANYKIVVEKNGFKRFVRQPVEVAVNASTRIDIPLTVGATSETVEVSTLAPLLQTDSATLSTQVEGTTVQEMPLNGRNVMNLIALTAGVVPQGSTSGSTAMNQTNQNHTNTSGWSNFQISGSMAGESALYTDGAPDNVLGGNAVGLVMTQDAVQEFNVASNNQTADFGRNGGGVVSMASKGGGNRLSGSAYEYFRNSFLNSNEFFNKQSQLQQGEANKPLKWNQNQYGVSVGGPIKKDKIFYHFTWEGFRAITSVTQPSAVPTDDMRNGLVASTISGSANTVVDVGALSYSGSQSAGPAGLSSCKIDTTSNPGYYTITNLWTSNCGDPLSKIMLTYYPEPTPNYSHSGDNYYIAPSAKDNQDQYNGRVDYALSSKQRLFARYTYWKLEDTGLSTFGDANGWPTANAAAAYYAHQAVLGDTYTLSPKTVLDVRLSYLRANSITSKPESLGISASKYPGTYFQSLYNQMSVDLLPYFGLNSGNYSIAGLRLASEYGLSIFNTDAISASLTHIQGNHSLKFGAELRKMDNTGPGGSVNSGSFTYNGAFTGDAWVDFLLGYTGNLSGLDGGSLGLANSVTGYNYYQAYYATDNWQVTHRLTLALGVRYELPGGIYSKHDLNTVLLPDYEWTSGSSHVNGALALVNSALYGKRSSINIKHDLVAPRIGFAYRLGSNSAVRGGYGLSYIAVDSGLPTGSPVNGWTNLCGSTYSTTANGKTVYYPNYAQQMYNCYGSTTIGSKTYSNALVSPPGRAYNGADLINYLGYLNQTTTSLSGPDPNQKYPYVQQWNLSFSHQMKGNLMVEVGYAGTKGTHLPALGTNFNQLNDSKWLQLNSTGTANLLAAQDAATFTATETGDVTDCWSGATVGQCSRPNGHYGNISDSLGYNAGSSYNALQVKAEKRFSAGGTVMANYTWAKTIGDTDSSLGNILENSSNTYIATSASIQDYDNMKSERSVLQYDVPQRAVVSYVVDLPFGRGKTWGNNATGVTDRLISGWAVNGITTFQRGFHLVLTDTVTSNSNSSAYNADLSKFGFGSLRPMYTVGCDKHAGLTGSYADRVIEGKSQFNTSCFSDSPNWTPGNEPRVDSNLFAQGIDNFDFSAVKTTKVTERTNIQFRAEFFNIFNRVQFSPPITQVGDSVNGVSQVGLALETANRPRLVQFSLRMSF